MNEENPLAKLTHQVHRLLRLYHQKDKWTHIAPLLGQVIERFDALFSEYPHAFIAQLQLHNAKQGYTTNLIFNQMILAHAISHGLSLSRASRAQLLSLVLSQYLCVREESNQLANGEKLNNEQVKIWRNKYLYACKLITQHAPSFKLVIHGLKALESALQGFQRNAFDAKQHQITELCAITQLIAKRITPSKSQRALPLSNAASMLYHHSELPHYKFYLSCLIDQLPRHLSGNLSLRNGSYCLYIGKLDNHKHLFFKLAEHKLVAKGQWLIDDNPYDLQSSAKPCQDNQLLYQLWLNALPKFCEKNQITLKPFHSPIAIEQLNFDCLQRADNRGIKPFVNAILQYPEASQYLLALARKYNRQGTPVSDLKHAVMLIGPGQVIPLLKVNYQKQLLREHTCLQWQQLLHRIEQTEQFIVKTMEFFEQPALDYVYTYYQYVNQLLDQQTPIVVLSHNNKQSHESPLFVHLFQLARFTQPHKLSSKSATLMAMQDAFNQSHSNDKAYSLLSLAMHCAHYFYHPNASTLKTLKTHFERISTTQTLDSYLDSMFQVHPSSVT